MRVRPAVGELFHSSRAITNGRGTAPSCLLPRLSTVVIHYRSSTALRMTKERAGGKLLPSPTFCPREHIEVWQHSLQASLTRRRALVSRLFFGYLGYLALMTLRGGQLLLRVVHLQCSAAFPPAMRMTAALHIVRQHSPKGCNRNTTEGNGNLRQIT